MLFDINCPGQVIFYFYKSQQKLSHDALHVARALTTLNTNDLASTPASCAVVIADVCLYSIAILLYLAEKFKTPDFWYPADLQQRARINEYLSWQHSAIRWQGSKMFWLQVCSPLLVKVQAFTSTCLFLTERLRSEVSGTERKGSQ